MPVNEGQQRFDGLQVELHQGRFLGTFDVDLSDASYLGLNGGEVMLVVVARPRGASIDETTAGDIKRVDKLGVREVAVVRSATLRQSLADTLGLELVDSQTFDFVATPVADEPVPEPAVLEAVDMLATEGNGLIEGTDREIFTPQPNRGPSVGTTDEVLRRFLDEPVSS